MELNDSLAIARSRRIVEAALQDPDVLAAILPGCTGVECLAPGQYRARIVRKFGLLTLRIEPDLDLNQTAEGLDLSIRAANRIAGSVNAKIALDLSTVPMGTKLAYRGRIVTSGLAARMLAEREAQVAQRIKAMFLALKARLEAS